jgi:predicted Rossmann fold nucleotide-binding protein DprA/Smf involved in DNA uptake
MKIAVVGSRSFNDANLLSKTVSEFFPSEIISGGAVGADRLAASWAKSNGIPLKEFLPDYTTYGRSAPIRRNDLIVDAADMVIAFWNGTSKGTKYTIDYASKKNKVTKIIRY